MTNTNLRFIYLILLTLVNVLHLPNLVFCRTNSGLFKMPFLDWLYNAKFGLPEFGISSSLLYLMAANICLVIMMIKAACIISALILDILGSTDCLFLQLLEAGFFFIKVHFFRMWNICYYTSKYNLCEKWPLHQLIYKSHDYNQVMKTASSAVYAKVIS